LIDVLVRLRLLTGVCGAFLAVLVAFDSLFEVALALVFDLGVATAFDLGVAGGLES
jgi:hypothetical protein